MRAVWVRPEAMPTIAVLLGFRETWLTLLFGVAMVALRFGVQGCAVAVELGTLASERSGCGGGKSSTAQSALAKTR